MRELWETGWMQQNVRMICAAFLVEFLGMNWVHGRRWFDATLVDADPAINAMMWQNAGRSTIGVALRGRFLDFSKARSRLLIFRAWP